MSETYERRPLATSEECTPPVARIIGRATRSGPLASSVSTMVAQPRRAASSASARMRSRLARRASPSRLSGAGSGMVQSMTATLFSPMNRAMRWYMPVVSTGLSNTKTSVWASS